MRQARHRSRAVVKGTPIINDVSKVVDLIKGSRMVISLDGFYDSVNDQVLLGGNGQLVIPADQKASSPEPSPTTSPTTARTPTPSPPPAPPAPQVPKISISQGGLAPSGYWYSAVLSGFAPGSSVTVACHDTVDRNFWTQTFTIDANGGASDATLCHSADGPDHWVTGGGVESNHLTW